MNINGLLNNDNRAPSSSPSRTAPSGPPDPALSGEAGAAAQSELPGLAARGHGVHQLSRMPYNLPHPLDHAAAQNVPPPAPPPPPPPPGLISPQRASPQRVHHQHQQHNPQLHNASMHPPHFDPAPYPPQMATWVQPPGAGASPAGMPPPASGVHESLPELPFTQDGGRPSDIAPPPRPAAGHSKRGLQPDAKNDSDKPPKAGGTANKIPKTSRRRTDLSETPASAAPKSAPGSGDASEDQERESPENGPTKPGKRSVKKRKKPAEPTKGPATVPPRGPNGKFAKEPQTSDTTNTAPPAAQMSAAAAREADEGQAFSGRLQYRWSILKKPKGSALTEADLHMSKTPVANFRPDRPGKYKLQVRIKGHGTSYTETTRFIVTDAASRSPPCAPEPEDPHETRTYRVKCSFPGTSLLEQSEPMTAPPPPPARMLPDSDENES